MNKKVIRILKKNPETPPPTNRFYKRTRFLVIHSILILSLTIGWSVSYIIHSKTNSLHELIPFHSDEKSLQKLHISDEDSKYEFLNPYILTPVFDKIFHQELTSFKDIFESYCSEAKKDKSIAQVSVYFRDLTTEAWFGVNEKERFIPASLTKVPILIAVYQRAENDPAYLQKRLIYKGSVSATYLKAHPEIDDIRTSLKPYETYTVEQLTNYMIEKSDNDAAMLLLEDIGTKNWLALQERLGNSVPINANSGANIITVKSYSAFFRILYNSSLLSREYSEKALEVLSKSAYENGLRRAVPSNIRICHKYGERDTIIGKNQLKIQQLHHAGIVYYPGKPFFICIMTKGTDKKKMEQIIYDISKIAYQQVDMQIKKLKKPALYRDIE